MNHEISSKTITKPGKEAKLSYIICKMSYLHIIRHPKIFLFPVHIFLSKNTKTPQNAENSKIYQLVITNILMGMRQCIHMLQCIHMSNLK